MALVIPPFSTSAVITGNTLISQADEQLNILMNDVDTYVVSTFNEVAQTLQGSMPSFGLDMSLNNTPNVGQMTWNQDESTINVKPNSNGLLTNIEPSDTQLKIPIAFVIHAHTSGTLLVRTTPIDENLYKPWTQSKFDLKADATSVYTKAQIDSLLTIVNNRLSALENV